MPPHRFPRPHGTDAPPPASDADFRPFDKLVIGLPSAMVSWGRAYGPATEWIATRPNPLDTSAPHRGGDADSRRGGDAAGDTSTATPDASADGPSGDVSGRGTAACAAASPAPTSTTTTRPFRCDPCDRTFAVESKYKEHMQSHIYCTVPGCNFTCRESRAFMMQEHMDCLHNRPDAPNLADTGAYLDQRKRRFPTQDVIQGKVEELYYKAARGVVLPDERRRWMKQYGIDVGKRPRSEASYIARGELPRTSRSPSPPSASADPAPANPTPPQTGEHVHAAAAAGGPPRFIQPPAAEAGAAAACETVMDPTAPPAVSTPRSQPPLPTALAASAAPALPMAAPTAVPAAAAAKAPGPRPIKMIPLGPNGTLTPRQRVQLVRERYARAEEVPQFYVCSRCGSKGEHWVDECPTKGDATYNRHVVWGEAKMVLEEGKAKAGQLERRDHRRGGGQGTSEEHREAEEEEDKSAATEPTAVGTHDEAPQTAPATEAPLADTQNDPTAMTDITSSHHQRSNDINNNNNNEEDYDDDAPPPSQSAAAPPGAPREVTRGMAPVAAARYAQPNRRDPPRRPPPPPTLYERLTEEERMNEQGLLLQAMRFFAARDFFKEKR